MKWEWLRRRLNAYQRCVKLRKFNAFLISWISLTSNTNAVSHIRGVGVNWALLRCIEIVSSTNKRHFFGYQSCLRRTTGRRHFIRKHNKNVWYKHFALLHIMDIPYSILTTIPRT